MASAFSCFSSSARSNSRPRGQVAKNLSMARSCDPEPSADYSCCERNRNVDRGVSLGGSEHGSVEVPRLAGCLPVDLRFSLASLLFRAPANRLKVEAHCLRPERLIPGRADL